MNESNSTLKVAAHCRNLFFFIKLEIIIVKMEYRSETKGRLNIRNNKEMEYMGSCPLYCCLGFQESLR